MEFTRESRIDETDEHGNSLLYRAVKDNDLELAKYLIVRGADVNKEGFEKNGMSGYNIAHYPIHSAQTPEMVNLLLENGAKLYATIISGEHITPLDTAASPEVAQAIIQHITNSDNLSPNKQAYLNSALAYKLSPPRNESDFAIAKFLLEEGANPNSIDHYRDPAIFNIIDEAAQLHQEISPQAHDLFLLMLEKGLNPNSIDNTGNTLLHNILETPLYETNRDIAEKLLDAGADINKLNRAGGPKERMMALAKALTREEQIYVYKTPLHRAIESGDIHNVEWALEHGANPKKPRSYDIKEHNLVGGLFYAQEHNFLGAVEVILKKLDGNIKAIQEPGYYEHPAINNAATNGRFDIVLAIAKAGGGEYNREQNIYDGVESLKIASMGSVRGKQGSIWSDGYYSKYFDSIKDYLVENGAIAREDLPKEDLNNPAFINFARTLWVANDMLKVFDPNHLTIKDYKVILSPTLIKIMKNAAALTDNFQTSIVEEPPKDIKRHYGEFKNNLEKLYEKQWQEISKNTDIPKTMKEEVLTQMAPKAIQAMMQLRNNEDNNPQPSAHELMKFDINVASDSLKKKFIEKTTPILYETLKNIVVDDFKKKSATRLGSLKSDFSISTSSLKINDTPIANLNLEENIETIGVSANWRTIYPCEISFRVNVSPEEFIDDAIKLFDNIMASKESGVKNHDPRSEYMSAASIICECLQNINTAHHMMSNGANCPNLIGENQPIIEGIKQAFSEVQEPWHWSEESIAQQREIFVKKMHKLKESLIKPTPIVDEPIAVPLNKKTAQARGS